MPKKRKTKQEEAVARQEERANRTPEEQLALIAKRPGKSLKERTRIARRSLSDCSGFISTDVL